MSRTQAKVTYIIDFDSTFTKVEALDELAMIVTRAKPHRTTILKHIKMLTDQAMSGDIDFREALLQRIALLDISISDLSELILQLKTKISDSFVQNTVFLKTHADDIFIVSGGFKDFILPVVTSLGIRADHVYANEFMFNEEDRVVGFDQTNLLAQTQGKVKLVKSLKLKGDIFVLGDGFTDYEIKEKGAATKFFLMTENITRDNLISKADEVVASLNDFLNFLKITRSLSYPQKKL